MPCNLCGSQETLQRKAIKAMLAEWERKHPGRIDQIFRGIGDVRPSQLADRQMFDFVALGAREGAAPDAAAWLLGDGPAAAEDAPQATAPRAAAEPRTGLEILGA
jgi:tRNA 2-thiocytidine biosynthesis protein TtcA